MRGKRKKGNSADNSSEAELIKPVKPKAKKQKNPRDKENVTGQPDVNKPGNPNMNIEHCEQTSNPLLESSLFYPSMQYTQPQQSSQPLQPLQPFCSTPTNYYQPIQHMASPPTVSAQKPQWVDDLFRKISNIENRLCKLDEIEKLVTSVNYKVNKVEQETQKLSNRLDEVEKCSQLISDHYDRDKQSIKSLQSELSGFKGLKTEIANINRKLESQQVSVKKVSEQICAQKNIITSATDQVRGDTEKNREEMIDLKINSIE